MSTAESYLSLSRNVKISITTHTKVLVISVFFLIVKFRRIYSEKANFLS